MKCARLSLYSFVATTVLCSRGYGQETGSQRPSTIGFYRAAYGADGKLLP